MMLNNKYNLPLSVKMDLRDVLFFKDDIRVAKDNVDSLYRVFGPIQRLGIGSYSWLEENDEPNHMPDVYRSVLYINAHPEMRSMLSEYVADSVPFTALADIPSDKRVGVRFRDVQQILNLFAFVSDAPSLLEPITLYRGLSWLKDFAPRVGDVFLHGANQIISTSSGTKCVFAGPCLRINVPAGTPALCLGTLNLREKEWLLPPSAWFKVIGIDENVIEVDYINGVVRPEVNVPLESELKERVFQAYLTNEPFGAEALEAYLRNKYSSVSSSVKRKTKSKAGKKSRKKA